VRVPTRVVVSGAVGLAIVLAAVAAVGVSRQRAVAFDRAVRLYPEARAVVDRHCVQCHSEHNTVPAFPIAADGLELDTAEQMQRSADRIRVRAVEQRDMPLLDKTGMTAEERAVLARWIDAGAAVPR
jgi:uncharacterized membrane protein